MALLGAASVPKADVLVLGGGPAGSAAAIRCAAIGMRVILVERELGGRERPGETLHPGIEPLLAQFGVAEEVLAAGFPRHEGNWIAWDGPPRFEAFGEDAGGPWRGFQAWRADFDALLLRRARDLGVRILQPCRALAPVVRAGRVTGLATAEGTIEAQFVVDAAGGSHLLARHLDLPIERFSPPLVAWYGYAEGACPARGDAPSIVADGEGWTWTARVLPGLYAWTRLSFDGSRPVEGWLPEELRGLVSRGRPRGANVTWRKVAAPAGPGYFLVGDSAAVLDPASSHGVLKAIMSGILAAHKILGIARGAVAEDEAAESYGRWIGDWFFHDAGKLVEMYRTGVRGSGDPLWQSQHPGEMIWTQVGRPPPRYGPSSPR
jgi:flavin-dependent dehydrogenase